MDETPDIIDALRKRNYLKERLQILRPAILKCLSIDGIHAEKTIADAISIAEIRTGIVLPKPGPDGRIRDSAVVKLPSDADVVTLEALVNVAGGQRQRGAWSVIHADLLFLWSSSSSLIEEYPIIIERHPELVISSVFTAENIQRYRSFVSAAYIYCEELRQTAEKEVQEGNTDKLEDLAIAKAACDTYFALRDFAIREQAAKDERDAAEQRRQAEAAEKARKESIDRGEFTPMKDADRWIDRQEAWDRFGRTA